MKLFPRVYDLFDDGFVGFNDNTLMKTDITEKEGQYLLDMELPGYKKEDIQLELKNGYLNVNASRNTSNEEKDAQGNVIRQERYCGSCSRSFYVGENIKQDDIKASFENGELKISLPKEKEVLPEKKTIMIE